MRLKTNTVAILCAPPTRFEELPWDFNSLKEDYEINLCTKLNELEDIVENKTSQLCAVMAIMPKDQSSPDSKQLESIVEKAKNVEFLLTGPNGSNSTMPENCFYIPLDTPSSCLKHNLKTLSLKTLNNSKNLKKIGSLQKDIKERTDGLSQALIDVEKYQDALFEQKKIAAIAKIAEGVAHELKNPINFIQNFSIGLKDIFQDIEQQIDKLNIPSTEPAHQSLMGDLRESRLALDILLKHAHRSNHIVSEMLKISLRGQEDKENVDIVDVINKGMYMSETLSSKRYPNLSVTTVLDLPDKEIWVNANSRQIHQVLLQLIDNAYYFCLVKSHADPEYEPKLLCILKDLGTSVRLVIEDNGIGIPTKDMDSIFFPFFTTRPTGKGVGLGLSICFDIILNGHGGEIKAESQENTFTRFTITLPKLPIKNEAGDS